MSKSTYIITRERTLYLNVTTLQGQTKACFLIFDKVQSHLRIALLLQVGNDRLTHQLGITNHVKHLERQREYKFERVYKRNFYHNCT